MPDLKELLGEELFNQVSTKLGDNKVAIVSDGNWIPKQKFDEVNQQKATFKTQNEELNTQLETLKKANKGNEELTKQIGELQGKLQESEAKNKDISLTAAIKMNALKANAKDIDVVAMLIDKTKIELNEDGSIKGLEEQIKTLSESKSYLFGETVPGGKGNNPPGAGGGTQNPWAKETFNLTEQGKLLKENPTLAAQLQAAAK